LPGKSLLSLLRGESAKWRQTLCAEYNAHEREAFYPRRSIRNDRYKLILNLLPDRDSPYWAAGECPAWMASRLDSLIGTEVRGAYDTYLHPPQVELYDLLRDPNEWRNLADDPRHDKIKGDLVKQLRRWRKATQDPYLDPDKLEKDTKKYLEK